MKAKVCTSLRSSEHFGLRMDSNVKIHKNRQFDDNEMHDCFMKLKELVPTIAVDQKLSKVQLIQHVIDYIMDLEITLDYNRPAFVTSSTTTTTTASTGTATAFERKPLSENNYFNTVVSVGNCLLTILSVCTLIIVSLIIISMMVYFSLRLSGK